MHLHPMPERTAIEPTLRRDLDRIDRQTVMLVACVPLLLTPLAIALGLSGWGMSDPSQARLSVPTGVIVIAQGLSCMLLAAFGRLRLALALAVIMTLCVVLHSSLWVGLGLRTPTFTAMAVLCFMAAYLYGSRIANAIAFINLSITLVVAMVVMINPAFLSDQQAPLVQPTAMLLSHLGLFINTQIICGAYSRKKSLLLQHINSQTHELEAALDKRRHALRERQNLLGQIAHNLRTPLATVNSALQLMERTAGQPERQQRYAANLRNAADKMLWQTRQFSTYERLQGNRIEVRKVSASVPDLIEQTVSFYAAVPQLRAVAIQTRIQPHVHTRMTLDPEHFTTMLRNLLDNALKYVQEGTVMITVDETTTGEDSCLLKMTVEDDGPGLSPEVQPELFKPFVQGTENPANAMEGSGLGLYITRGLARKMGGDAGADNREQGGCRAWFTLKAQPASKGMRQAA